MRQEPRRSPDVDDPSDDIIGIIKEDAVAGPGDATEQIEEVRRRTIAVLDDVVEKAGMFELAEPPAAFGRCRRKLRENTYKVLVVGEAKRGKSTFVNALIGRDVLPTDVDVATSQVFNIRPSEREAYRLRFEDGSEREISREDLPLYGSQIMADARAVPATDQIIRWIEVDTPTRYLPEGLSILDTPGLGALYAGHARITHRFVPEADAVIFVLESGQPVIEEDLKFIEEILNVTRNIFFIQTKIDQYGKEDWQDVLRRNEEILGESLKGRLADVRVWPVSSTNLRKAATSDEKTEEEAYLMVSRHRELAVALRAFLARVAGWSRAAKTMLMIERYHATSHKALAGRLAGFAEESEKDRFELQRIAMQSKRQFEDDWGAGGHKLGELREDLGRSVAEGRQSFAQALQPGGEIDLAQKAKIDAIRSLDDADRIAKEMPGEVFTAATNKWFQVCKEVQDRCAELLGPFSEAVDEVSAPLDPNVSGLKVQDSSLDNGFKRDYTKMLDSAMGGGAALSGAMDLFGFGFSLAMLAPVALIAAVPALLVLVGGGIVRARRARLEEAQEELRAHLQNTLHRLCHHFFVDVDLATGQLCRVDEYFRALERAMSEQLRRMVAKKSGEADAEIARLTEAAKLDDQERRIKAEQTREQLVEWEKIGNAAREVMERIKALEESGPGWRRSQDKPLRQGLEP